jgi:hypothetical protein
MLTERITVDPEILRDPLGSRLIDFRWGNPLEKRSRCGSRAGAVRHH